MNRDPYGRPEWLWLFTACMFLLFIVQLYLQVFKPLSAARGVDEGHPAPQCRCLVETP